jgi:hypothetical protein
MNTNSRKQDARSQGQTEGSGLNNPQGVDTMTALKALQKLAPFITRGQWHTLWKLCQSGEEQAYFRQMVQDLTTRIEAMPQTYEQDGLGLRAIAYLHYFTPAFDFYITEKDRTGDGTQQAFGLACAHEREIGYISIRQLVEAGAELDLYWTPKTLAAIGR